MEAREFIKQATELVEKIVNHIADKKYAELASIAKIDESWIDEGQTLEQAFVSFGKWLDEQLEMWAEDEEREFVVDRFDASRLDDEIEVEDDDRAFASYSPTNSGEQLDFWFEFDFAVGGDGKVAAKFNVNV